LLSFLANEKNKGLTNKNVYSLKINNSNIFVGTSAGVYLSSDNGEVWIEKNNGLTDTIVHSFAIIGNNIFAATNGGAYLSTDYGHIWIAKNIGLTNNYVLSFVISNDYIYAGTRCGIYRAKLEDFGINDVNVEISQNNLLQISPNPSSDFIYVKYNDELINKNIKIYDILGNTVWQGIPKGESISIDISSFPFGVYYIKAGNETKMFVKN
ncbi:MAG: T9SS type A sorting domain-containing protein, partial [Bacteroidetes bacterium]|nr:T9SS type A sorting domain-containing protein [Bacteroidota bacterium]